MAAVNQFKENQGRVAHEVSISVKACFGRAKMGRELSRHFCCCCCYTIETSLRWRKRLLRRLRIAQSPLTNEGLRTMQTKVVTACFILLSLPQA